jgi:hypothetical protein
MQEDRITSVEQTYIQLTSISEHISVLSTTTNAGGGGGGGVTCAVACWGGIIGGGASVLLAVGLAVAWRWRRNKHKHGMEADRDAFEPAATVTNPAASEMEFFDHHQQRNGGPVNRNTSSSSVRLMTPPTRNRDDGPRPRVARLMLPPPTATARINFDVDSTSSVDEADDGDDEENVVLPSYRPDGTPYFPVVTTTTSAAQTSSVSNHKNFSAFLLPPPPEVPPPRAFAIDMAVVAAFLQVDDDGEEHRGDSTFAELQFSGHSVVVPPTASSVEDGASHARSPGDWEWVFTEVSAASPNVSSMRCLKPT